MFENGASYCVCRWPLPCWNFFAILQNFPHNIQVCFHFFPTLLLQSTGYLYVLWLCALLIDQQPFRNLYKAQNNSIAYGHERSENKSSRYCTARYAPQE